MIAPTHFITSEDQTVKGVAVVLGTRQVCIENTSITQPDGVTSPVLVLNPLTQPWSENTTHPDHDVNRPKIIIALRNHAAISTLREALNRAEKALLSQETIDAE